MLNAASRVTVYAGAGCEGARSQVIRLCDTLQAPMVHTSRAKDFVEPENPYISGQSHCGWRELFRPSAGMGLFAEKRSSVHKALRVSRRNRP